MRNIGRLKGRKNDQKVFITKTKIIAQYIVIKFETSVAISPKCKQNVYEKWCELLSVLEIQYHE